MTYNGRAVMAEVAEANGWAVIDDGHGADRNGQTLVAYERYSTQILIRWTPENAATFIARNYGNADQMIATGPLGLVTARGWMES